MVKSSAVSVLEIFKFLTKSTDHKLPQKKVFLPRPEWISWLGVVPQPPRLQVQFLVRTHAEAAGLSPPGVYEKQPINVSPPIFLPPLPLFKKKKSFWSGQHLTWQSLAAHQTHFPFLLGHICKQFPCSQLCDQFWPMNMGNFQIWPIKNFPQLSLFPLLPPEDREYSRTPKSSDVAKL